MLRVLLITTVIRQNGVCGVQSVGCHYLRHQWVDALFKRLNLAAIDSQFRTSTVGILGVTIFIEKLTHAVGDNRLSIVVLKLYIGILQEVANTLYQRVVIDHVGKVGVLDGQRFRDRQWLCTIQIRCS